MESLAKDVVVEMALNLLPVDLINFCITEKKYKKIVCDSKIFWLKKINKDYPNEIVTVENAKTAYMQKFRAVSIKIEKFIDNMFSEIFNESFLKFVNLEYKQLLYRSLYKLYNDTKNDLSKRTIKNSEELEEYFLDIFYDTIPLYVREFYPNEELGKTMEIKCQYFYPDLIRDEILKVDRYFR